MDRAISNSDLKSMSTSSRSPSMITSTYSYSPAGNEGDLSQRDLQTEASYPRDKRPLATILLQSSFFLQFLFFSTIFAASASRFLSDTLEHGAKLLRSSQASPPETIRPSPPLPQKSNSSSELSLQLPLKQLLRFRPHFNCFSLLSSMKF